MSALSSSELVVTSVQVIPQGKIGSLTVLICTHNRVELLGKTLASLNAGARPMGWRVEILVIANACTDATHDFLEHHAPGLPLRWYAEPTPGKSHALNHAIPLIDADLVAFVDDDHRVDSAYLTAVCQAAEAYPETGLFCGRILPDWDGSEPTWIHDRGRYRIYPLPVPRFELGDEAKAITPEVAIPGGGNLFLRGDWLRRVGPFSVDFGPVGHNLGGSEDTDWVLRALALGATLRYVPQVIQYHHVDHARLKLRYLMAKAFERTASTTRMRPSGNDGIPLYLFRKLCGHTFAALTAWSQARRRFFLMRLAASLGEFKGHRQASWDRSKGTT